MVNTHTSMSFLSFNKMNLIKERDDNMALIDVTSVSHKNASLTYILPMATTEKIKAKSSDTRIGLLGMANDCENFGDLYVVGRDGKSHLTRSGIKTETIFEGSASTVGTYQMKGEIKSFKGIIVYSNIDDTGGVTSYAMSSVIVTVDDLNHSINRLIRTGSSIDGWIDFTINVDTNTLEISSIENGTGVSTHRIFKVVGIY